jgi:hypothetical protein
MLPAFFDEDGILYGDNSYGDYPHFSPSAEGHKGEFAGWMLLSYKKPVKVSSYQKGSAAKAEGFAEWNRPETSPDFKAANLTDENCKTYWLAGSNTSEEWAEIDLEDEADVYAIQINFYDHKANLYGRVDGLSHRFILQASLDGEKWRTIENRKNSNVDAPNAYIQLKKPVKARYIRYENIKVPSNNLAISEIRVFGKGSGEAPEAVEGFKSIISSDGREARLSWQPVAGAQGYNISWGIAPDKMYNDWLVYSDTSLTLRCLNAGTKYYFSINAFNSNGILPRSDLK